MSVNILDDILADNVHDISEADLSEDEIKHVKAMITSEKGGLPPPKGKRWLYEVCHGILILLVSLNVSKSEHATCVALSHACMHGPCPARLEGFLLSHRHSTCRGSTAVDSAGEALANYILIWKSHKKVSQAMSVTETVMWLYQIVANNRNGLDVDKYDYLQRDALYCNVRTSVDINRIMTLAKVRIDFSSLLLWLEGALEEAAGM